MEKYSMLELNNIVKLYSSGDTEVRALNGVSLKFRENEFVSILGKSGCGKTTMLNIIGGLDRYTSGDLIISGKSTKEFKDGDWDVYRNHSIGFVFQSYNLIPHQTVLANVELALTLSGVSKAERRRRAVTALEKVGLGDQLKKKPNQMSGGQMQRVAIARALVNDPEILLADEPTGALDSHTSVQIMELLKEVAKEKLVIMVTHNPDLAKEYSTRIVRLSDGEVIDDSNPYGGEDVAVAQKPTEVAPKKTKKAKKIKKKTMSFPTALSLSLNNLLTKKARTILTSFAGSIGIIGIALILSLSNGIQAYIDQVQEDTLSTYPLTISKSTQDYTAMLSAMTTVSKQQENIDPNKIYVDDSLGTMMSAMSATVSNNLEAFKAYLEENGGQISDSVSDIQYTYDFDLQIFTADGKTQVSPTEIFDNMGSSFAGISEMMDTMGGLGIMSEMINNQALLDQQYELVGENSHWPTNANEVVLVVNRNNQISMMTLYMLGVEDQSKLEEIMTKLMTEGTYESDHMKEYTLDDFIGMKFRLLNTSDFFEKTTKTYTVDGKEYPIWSDLRENPIFEEQDQAKFVTENGEELVISGIIRPRAGTTATSISGAIGYTKALTDKILALNTESEVIKQQKETPEYNVVTGLKFERTHYTPETIGDLIDKIDDATMAQFYPFVTQMILTNPELAAMLDVKDAQSLLGVLFLMPTESQVQTISAIHGAAMRNNYNGVKALTDILTMMGAEPKVQITPENFLKLLPVMSTEQLALALMGMPANPDTPMMPPITGLITLAGDDMTGIYAAVSSALKTMEVNEEIFTRLIENGNAFIPDFANSETFLSLEETLYKMAPQTDATYESTLKLLGDAEKASPASINFYAKDFESKDKIEAFIKEYNDAQTEDNKKIEYTDLIGIMMSSVSTIINVISYVLIAFVSISLVVSSIMIGIITYISVLERTKEIGILRSIGASKKDISRVFNAETLIVGLAAGLFGIIFTVLLCLPINAIIHAISGITTVNAVLPAVGGVALVLISMLLTFIAGLIPSGIAAKKDPVEALRTE